MASVTESHTIIMPLLISGCSDVCVAASIHNIGTIKLRTIAQVRLQNKYYKHKPLMIYIHEVQVLCINYFKKRKDQAEQSSDLLSNKLINLDITCKITGKS